MNKYVKNNTNQRWFVQGSGFTASRREEASAIGCEQVNALATLGFDITVSSSESFAVCYVRKEDLYDDGSVGDNDKNPSPRRFATEDEARIHGSRFHVRKAKGSNVPGSAGHVGFYVIKTEDPVNAKVNPETGLTNRA